MMKRIGVCVLAAGVSQRMGRAKLLLPLKGKAILTHGLDTLSKLEWGQKVAVIGEPKKELIKLCEASFFPWIYNDNYQEGKAASIRAGLNHFPADLDGYLFLPGDQPFVSHQLLMTIVEKFVCHGDHSSVTAPFFQGQFRSPVLFGASWREELLSLTGDNGGSILIRCNPSKVHMVPWQHGEDFLDIDTPEDYQSAAIDNC